MFPKMSSSSVVFTRRRKRAVSSLAWMRKGYRKSFHFQRTLCMKVGKMPPLYRNTIILHGNGIVTNAFLVGSGKFTANTAPSVLSFAMKSFLIRKGTRANFKKIFRRISSSRATSNFRYLNYSRFTDTPKIERFLNQRKINNIIWYRLSIRGVKFLLLSADQFSYSLSIPCHEMILKGGSYTCYNSICKKQ